MLQRREMWGLKRKQSVIIQLFSKLKANALQKVTALGIYHSDAGVESLQHMPVVEHAIHFRCECLPGSEMLSRVENMTAQNTASVHSGCTNGASNEQ